MANLLLLGCALVAAFCSGGCAVVAAWNGMEGIFDWRPFAAATVLGCAMTCVIAWMAVRP